LARPSYGYRNKDDKRVPGVTTVLGVTNGGMSPDALCGWAVKLSKQGKNFKQERELAGAHGTMLHELCETKLPNDLVEADRPEGCDDNRWAALKASYGAILAWERKHAPKTVLAEKPLVSELYQYGGTLDRVATMSTEPYVQDGPWLLDYKTGSHIGPKEVAQMAAYRQLLRECEGIDVQGAVLIHAPTRDAGYMRPIRLTPAMLDIGWSYFESSLRVYRCIPPLAEVCE
jgi:hypothetical protein